MELVDIGFNFTHHAFDPDRETVIDRAVAAGVTQMICTGADLKDSLRSVTLAEQMPDHLTATAGFHPHQASAWQASSAMDLYELARTHLKIKALGEMGLDFNRNYSPRSAQERVFEAQLEIATALELPVFLHQRDAHESFMRILGRYRSRLNKAVIHCFTGTENELRAYLDLDLHIGITGWICDPRRGYHLKDLLPLIPANRLMIETDAPYLLPRDQYPKPASRRNEPAYLPHILKTVATAVRRPVKIVADETTATAYDFFNLDCDLSP